LGFVVAAAFVSSSLQLVVSDVTGHGASGFVYAMVGFIWVAGKRLPRFKDMLDTRTLQIFTIWLVACIVATQLKIWQVANAAHVSGLLFGAVVAGVFYLPGKRLLMLTGLAVILAASTVPLFWCPWSPTWLTHQAYDAHLAGNYDAAVKRYTQLIARAGESVWALENRASAYQSLGEMEKAEADFRRVRELDPSKNKSAITH
jgi:GlpG protein